MNRFSVLGFAVLLLAGSLSSAQQSTPTTPIPDYVSYRHILHQVVLLKNKSDAAAAVGQDRSALRQIVRTAAGLTVEQGAILETIALQSESEVAVQDAKAQVIANQFRSRFPYGMIPKGASTSPPPELIDMQMQRNSIILLARDRLRNALGEDAFLRFDTFVKQKSLAQQTTH